jgi:hypothetical protein
VPLDQCLLNVCITNYLQLEKIGKMYKTGQVMLNIEQQKTIEKMYYFNFVESFNKIVKKPAAGSKQ